MALGTLPSSLHFTQTDSSHSNKRFFSRSDLVHAHVLFVSVRRCVTPIPLQLQPQHQDAMW